MTNDPSQGFEPYVNGGAQSVYRAWYPDGGGNLTVRAGANLIGDVMLASPASYGRPVTSSIGYNSDTPGNWLWRQGSGSAAIGQAQPPPGGSTSALTWPATSTSPPTNCAASPASARWAAAT